MPAISQEILPDRIARPRRLPLPPASVAVRWGMSEWAPSGDCWSG
ncbi:MAG: hypothetical protein OXU61_12795 [Gammaproteobacteria bacterium]|nr:hypothetical protein [Gammaproteobacteria bacterium]